MSNVDAQFIEPVFGKRQDLPGTLISIVGFDGSGKTTQIERLAQRLRSAGTTVIETRQPSDWYRNETSVQNFHDVGGPAETARILALFAAADRLRHVQEVILPALRRGDTVICDRYVYATFGVFIHRGVDPQFLVTINQGIPKPHRAFYLDVPVPTLLARLHSRDGDKLKHEEKTEERVRSITSTYDALGDQLIRIDGTGSVDDVNEAIWSHLPRQGHRAA